MKKWGGKRVSTTSLWDITRTATHCRISGFYTEPFILNHTTTPNELQDITHLFVGHSTKRLYLCAKWPKEQKERTDSAGEISSDDDTHNDEPQLQLKRTPARPAPRYHHSSQL